MKFPVMYANGRPARKRSGSKTRKKQRKLRNRVHALTHRKTINADTAVQVALLNNKGLQAAYADIGLNAAEVWQQALLENPKVSVEMLGIGAPGLPVYRSIEGWIATNILSLATQRQARCSCGNTISPIAEKSRA